MRSSAFFFAAFLRPWSFNLAAAFLSAMAFLMRFLTCGGRACNTALASFASFRSAAVKAVFFLPTGVLGFVVFFFLNLSIILVILML